MEIESRRAFADNIYKTKTNNKWKFQGHHQVEDKDFHYTCHRQMIRHQGIELVVARH